MTAAFYNAFFTSLPIGAFALFDRPVRRLGTLLAAPQAYNRKPPLTTRAFWKTGILTAIVHASVRKRPSQLLMHCHVQALQQRTAYSAIRALYCVNELFTLRFVLRVMDRPCATLQYVSRAVLITLQPVFLQTYDQGRFITTGTFAATCTCS